jgi:6-phosphogluconolactonase
LRLLIGSYTRGTRAEGIYAVEFEPETGSLSDVKLLVAADNPSFLVLSEGLLFACSEIRDGDDGGEIVVFSVTPEKVLLHQVMSSHGADPCHVAVCDTRVAVANYTGGTVALYGRDEGRIGALIANPTHALTGPHSRQNEPHPHGVYFIGSELWVTDLGGDTIARYRIDDGTYLGAAQAAPGSGPRHLTSCGTFLVNELSNTVSVMAEGEVTQSTSTLPEDWSGESTASEIVQRGARLYVGNRGHDSIGVFATEPELEVLQMRACGGRHPRHFAIDPSGHWLIVANQDTDNLVAMSIDADGTLGDTTSDVYCPSPACVAFDAGSAA